SDAVQGLDVTRRVGRLAIQFHARKEQPQLRQELVRKVLAKVEAVERLILEGNTGVREATVGRRTEEQTAGAQDAANFAKVLARVLVVFAGVERIDVVVVLVGSGHRSDVRRKKVQIGPVVVFLRLMDRVLFFFASRRLHTRLVSDWSSDVCSSD